MRSSTGRGQGSGSEVNYSRRLAYLHDAVDRGKVPEIMMEGVLKLIELMETPCSE